MKHATTRELYDYWNRVRGGERAPLRSAIEPSDIRRILGEMFILEVLDRDSYHVRLAGTRICALYCREIKGTQPARPVVGRGPTGDGDALRRGQRGRRRGGGDDRGADRPRPGSRLRDDPPAVASRRAELRPGAGQLSPPWTGPSGWAPNRSSARASPACASSGRTKRRASCAGVRTRPGLAASRAAGAPAGRPDRAAMAIFSWWMAASSKSFSGRIGRFLSLGKDVRPAVTAY